MAKTVLVINSGSSSIKYQLVDLMSMPGVATTGILTFVGSWNAYMLPLFVLSDANKYTLPLGVHNQS